MAEHLSWNIFPLLNQANNNDADRPGSLLLEYWEAEITTSSDTGDAEVPTSLDEVLGLIPLQFNDEFGSGDYILSLSTDAVITTGAVTVRLVLPAGGTDGAHTCRGFFVGTKSPTVLINTPTE